jgi:hypothetical protein
MPFRWMAIFARLAGEARKHAEHLAWYQTYAQAVSTTAQVTACTTHLPCLLQIHNIEMVRPPASLMQGVRQFSRAQDPDAALQAAATIGAVSKTAGTGHEMHLPSQQICLISHVASQCKPQHHLVTRRPKKL